MISHETRPFILTRVLVHHMESEVLFYASGKFDADGRFWGLLKNEHCDVLKCIRKSKIRFRGWIGPFGFFWSGHERSFSQKGGFQKLLKQEELKRKRWEEKRKICTGRRRERGGEKKREGRG